MIKEDYYRPDFLISAFYRIGKRYKTAITTIVIVDIPIGNHTGAIQGRGIRKRTSIVVR